MTAPLTADQLTQGIANAIRARDFEAVVDMLQALTFIDVNRAMDIWDTLQAAIAIGTWEGIPDAADLKARLEGGHGV